MGKEISQVIRYPPSSLQQPSYTLGQTVPLLRLTETTERQQCPLIASHTNTVYRFIQL